MAEHGGGCCFTGSCWRAAAVRELVSWESPGRCIVRARRSCTRLERKKSLGEHLEDADVFCGVGSEFLSMCWYACPLADRPRFGAAAGCFWRGTGVEHVLGGGRAPDGWGWEGVIMAFGVCGGGSHLVLCCSAGFALPPPPRRHDGTPGHDCSGGLLSGSTRMRWMACWLDEGWTRSDLERHCRMLWTICLTICSSDGLSFPDGICSSTTGRKAATEHAGWGNTSQPGSTTRLFHVFPANTDGGLQIDHDARLDGKRILIWGMGTASQAKLSSRRFLTAESRRLACFFS